MKSKIGQLQYFFLGGGEGGGAFEKLELILKANQHSTVLLNMCLLISSLEKIPDTIILILI